MNQSHESMLYGLLKHLIFLFYHVHFKANTHLESELVKPSFKAKNYFSLLIFFVLYKAIRGSEVNFLILKMNFMLRFPYLIPHGHA